ncbi:NUDIX hydrolase [Azotobacter vinelandii CA]|uniref:NUDIX hydrolase n=2 Tax=Azotobacter vinelandii TaxID=354 RepID=C1DDZ4_AZOVD|nr:NUDIX hydrolase [Azotobacter vinelandii]ACO80102.1 NUDIX hydrolase [Azotobacter vinelandii DJ]AGK14491.1 NUDIX hydrolase [Azotobacter vinelandii CA]AGK21693.1 NUDIX hydrolase [Azotobacter vinelandii CA6]WKN20922.1 NUDIX hydrolase [Azotobacter vinelandii]SFX19697.1 ADP-ribose pyrophosphatase YjhB, NUDIX family [Azotobacter vinelandii]
MKFCSQCGSPVSWQTLDGDHRPRFVCSSCRTVHYQNPRIVAGCLPLWRGQVLLCRRAIEPRRGFWTLPGGFLENGETMKQGAARETLEEACAHVERLELYTLFDLPHIHQVHVFFRARLVDTRFAAGEESLEVRLFREAEIPWRELAFPTVGHTLKYFFEDRVRQLYPVRNEPLAPLPMNPLERF